MKPSSTIVKGEQLSPTTTTSSPPPPPSTTTSAGITHQHNTPINTINSAILPSASNFPSCIPLKSSAPSFVPPQHNQHHHLSNQHHHSQPPSPQQQQNFNSNLLPSIHNLTHQPQHNQTSSTMDYQSHYQQSWRVAEQKTTGNGHDLIEALSPPALRYGTPHHQAILQQSIEIVPMDSYIPGYISGYRNPIQQLVGSEMQPTNPATTSTATGAVAVTPVSTINNTHVGATPIKISQYVADDLNGGKPQMTVASSCSAPTTPPADSSQARMACINCRKSHRKW